MQTELKHFSFDKLREKNPELAARRDAELALLRHHLGRMPVSQPLPKTDKEAASIPDEIVASLEALPEQNWYSISELLTRHRNKSEDLSLADFGFVHAPGGHDPMVDFHDNPNVGELLHTLHESDVPISLICHAPIAMTSARCRVDADGNVTVNVNVNVNVNEDHQLAGAHITTGPKYGELPMLKVGYPAIPGPEDPTSLLRRRRPGQGHLGPGAQPPHRKRPPIR